jgi:hypothetical protein
MFGKEEACLSMYNFSTSLGKRHGWFLISGFTLVGTCSKNVHLPSILFHASNVNFGSCCHTVDLCSLSMLTLLSALTLFSVRKNVLCFKYVNYKIVSVY